MDHAGSMGERAQRICQHVLSGNTGILEKATKTGMELFWITQRMGLVTSKRAEAKHNNKSFRLHA